MSKESSRFVSVCSSVKVFVCTHREKKNTFTKTQIDRCLVTENLRMLS